MIDYDNLVTRRGMGLRELIEQLGEPVAVIPDRDIICDWSGSGSGRYPIDDDIIGMKESQPKDNIAHATDVLDGLTTFNGGRR